MKIPKFPVFRREKAIRFLRDLINEFEEQRSKELTEKQVAALIKIAKGLISSIEAEMCAKDKPQIKINISELIQRTSKPYHELV